MAQSTQARKDSTEARKDGIEEATGRPQRQYNRLSVNINDDTSKALKELMDAHDLTVTELVRRAVGVYKYLDDEQREGGSIQVVKGKDRTTLAFI